jgi:hypothetical protein
MAMNQNEEGWSWSKFWAIAVPVLTILGLVALVLGNSRKQSKPTGSPRRKSPSKLKPRAFISFAAEDAQARDLFVGQSRHPDTPWEIADYSLHEPFENAWKAKTKPRIKGCDVVVLLIGRGTHEARGALWEVETAQELGVPVFGIHISKDDRGKLPGCMFGRPVINWTWKGIARQIKKAARVSRRS